MKKEGKGEVFAESFQADLLVHGHPQSGKSGLQTRHKMQKYKENCAIDTWQCFKHDLVSAE